MRAILSQGTRTEQASCLPWVLLLSLSFIGISKFSLFANSLKWHMVEHKLADFQQGDLILGFLAEILFF